MARHKEFDPTVALGRAMELFWRHGYEATTLADLTAELGIGKASLYATFGSKHDLYVRALEHYAQTRDPSILAALSNPGPVLPAVREVVRSWAEPDPDQPPGCLITNASTECRPDDAPVRRQVQASTATVEVALHAALLRAAAQGELAPGRDPATLARFLVVLMQGVQVVDCCDDRTRARAAVEQALVLLD